MCNKAHPDAAINVLHLQFILSGLILCHCIDHILLATVQYQVNFFQIFTILAVQCK